MLTKTVNKKLAVLGYHKVGKPYPGGWETWYYVAESDFVNQLKYLHENNWKVIDLSTFLRGIVEPDILPNKAALITFDDGHKSVHDFALPILKIFNYPAVLFIPTGFIGKKNSFDNLAEPEEPICDRDELQELELNGVAVQSHGVSHLSMSELTLLEQEAELQFSKAVLEDILQRSVDTFAFPYGDNGFETALMENALKRAGYKAAFLYGGGIINLPLDDPFQIERLAIGSDTNLKAMMEFL
jgi:peptidoglycan/xylan/chitin deacetylase (PgdA/CDA1 family)